MKDLVGKNREQLLDIIEADVAHFNKEYEMDFKILYYERPYIVWGPVGQAFNKPVLERNEFAIYDKKASFFYYLGGDDQMVNALAKSIQILRKFAFPDIRGVMKFDARS